MDIIVAAEAIITAEANKIRDEFYADDAVWAHEDCGTECDGSDH